MKKSSPMSVCRLCCESDGVIDIFSENAELQLSRKIRYVCAKVSVEEGDGLPKLICISCECELENSYQFAMRCEVADKKLRSLNLEHKPVIKAEHCEDSDNIYYGAPPGDTFDEGETCKQEFDIKEEGGQSEQSDQIEDAIKPKRKYKMRIPKIKKKYKCLKCSRVFYNASTLALHMRSHSEEKPFSCQVCDKKYKQKGTLMRHIETNHLPDRVRKFICEHCGKGFFTKSGVKVHMRTHTGETPYACNVCPAKFTQIGSLNRHKVVHSGDKIHMCATCSKRFASREELKKHFLVHTTEKQFLCPTCNVRFKHKTSLNKHQRAHLVKTCYICNHCGQSFNAKGNLKLHINRRHSDNSGFCNLCLKNVSNIEVHMWKHTGHRPLKCEYCPSSFNMPRSLTKHINFKHKNVDKFKCSVEGCTSKFPSQLMLDFHTMKFHTHCVPFSCDKCTRQFYRKSDMVRHKIGTHKERHTD